MLEQRCEITSTHWQSMTASLPRGAFLVCLSIMIYNTSGVIKRWLGWVK